METNVCGACKRALLTDETGCSLMSVASINDPTHWLDRPTRFSHEYYRRLEYPNPGLQGWQKMFGDVGYGAPIVFPPILGFEKFSSIIGDKYLTTIEGIAGAVYLWKKR
jgi:hypothetical protein